MGFGNKHAYIWALVVLIAQCSETQGVRDALDTLMYTHRYTEHMHTHVHKDTHRCHREAYTATR